MLIICQIDWREVGVAFELQCLRNCTLSSYLYIKVQATTSDHVGQLARSAVGQLAAAGRNRVDITACSVQLSAVTGYARWSVCPFIYGLHCTVV